MIFVTRDLSEKPLFIGFINGVNERDMPNGGKQKTFIIGTSEKKMNSDEKIYSSWFATMIGKAKDKSDTLKKGDKINVYGFKQNNVSKKNEDGTFGKAFFNLSISEYTTDNESNNNSGNKNPWDE